MWYWYFILLTKRITVVLQIGFELFHNVLYGTAINFGSYYIRVFGWLRRLENMMRVRVRFCFLTFCHNKISLRSSKNPAIHQKFQNDVLRCNMNMDVLRCNIYTSQNNDRKKVSKYQGMSYSLLSLTNLWFSGSDLVIDNW